MIPKFSVWIGLSLKYNTKAGLKKSVQSVLFFLKGSNRAQQCLSAFLAALVLELLFPFIFPIGIFKKISLKHYKP